MEASSSHPFNLSAQKSAMTPQKEIQFSINSLLSPPETKRQDNFSTPMSIAMSRTPSSSFSSTSYPTPRSSMTLGSGTTRPALLSPPISPLQNVEVCKEDVEGVKDPPLFPRQDSTLTEATEPLFPDADAMDVDPRDAVIKKHMLSSAIEDPSTRPTAQEYAIVADTLESLSRITFTPTVFDNVKKDPSGYLRREMATWDFYLAQGPKKNKKTSQKKVYRELKPAPTGLTRKPKVVIPRIRSNPKPRRSTPQRQFDEFAFPQYSPPLPKAPRAPTTRDDNDYNSLPDYSPPISTLPNNSKALKADWKGQMLDLSDDPDRNQLHEAEINLAATLRLTCAVYLSSKRRIFIARIDALRIGKEFRKTDAQQACKIDVNKASKLWTAFEKVGWFDAKWFVDRV